MTPTPPASSPLADQVHRDLLTLAYPAFTITRQHYTWRRPRWEAIRKDPAASGLYAVITPDLDELAAALAAITTTASAVSPATRSPAGPRP
jgi:hypothetical protein